MEKITNNNFVTFLIVSLSKKRNGPLTKVPNLVFMWRFRNTLLPFGVGITMTSSTSINNGSELLRNTSSEISSRTIVILNLGLVSLKEAIEIRVIVENISRLLQVTTYKT